MCYSLVITLAFPYSGIFYWFCFFFFKQKTAYEMRISDWSSDVCSSDLVDYDADADRYALSPEQALCMADPDGPVDVPGAYSIVEAAFHAMERTAKNFR